MKRIVTRALLASSCAGGMMLVPGVAGASGASLAAADASMCTAPTAHASLAAKLSKDIRAAMSGRTDTIAVTVYDRRTAVVCRWNEGHRFDSASVVKATILAALLRWHQETGRALSSKEKSLATAMITESDNDAASALWAEVGHARLQHFLDLAKMTETQLGPSGYWGLTQITARDELSLLRLLTKSNSVLSDSSRSYELGLMSRVISSQRWGVPAGAPSAVTVHVKNGWLPRATRGWRINSIGSFSGHGRDYMIVVLTDDNPTMAYGVDTVERIAKVVHRDLNAGLPASAVLPAVRVPQDAQVPDETLPALPDVP